MQRPPPPSLPELFSFVIDHWIIFSVGMLVMCLSTFYVFKNTYFVPIATFIQARLFVIVAWWLFYIVLMSEQNETLTAVAAIWGTIFIAGTCLYVWVEKTQ